MGNSLSWWSHWYQKLKKQKCSYHSKVWCHERRCSNNQALTFCPSVVGREAKRWLALLQDNRGHTAQIWCHLGWDLTTLSWVLTAAVRGPLEHARAIPMLQTDILFHVYINFLTRHISSTSVTADGRNQEQVTMTSGKCIWRVVAKDLDLACFC